jgi:hypothetical protein
MLQPYTNERLNKMAHSALVGGSSADRFIHCIGSDKLIATLPTTAETSVFALEGTLLHNAMEDIIANDLSVEDTIGKAYDVGVDDKGDVISMEIDDEHITEKIYPAFAWFNEYCPLDAEIWLEHRRRRQRATEILSRRGRTARHPSKAQEIRSGDLSAVRR